MLVQQPQRQCRQELVSQQKESHRASGPLELVTQQKENHLASASQELVNQQEANPKSTSVAVMMNALRQKNLRKRKADDPPIEQSKLQATHQSVVAKAASAFRSARKKLRKEQQQNSCSG